MQKMYGKMYVGKLRAEPQKRYLLSENPDKVFIREYTFLGIQNYYTI